MLGRRLLHVPSADWSAGQVADAFRLRHASDSVARLEDAAAKALGCGVVAFGSARAALAAILIECPPASGAVLLPAYTCVAVPNSVRTAGCETRWLDVSGPNIDPAEVLRTARPGDAVIAQHTYGVVPDREAMAALVARGTFVIEDRAHRFDGDDLIGDAAVFSLEHSKVVSAGQGGLAWARDPALLERLATARDTFRPLSSAGARQVLWTSATQVALANGAIPKRISSVLRRAALRMPVISRPAQSPGELAGAGVLLQSMHPAFAWTGVESIRRAPANIGHRAAIGAIYRSRLGSLIPDWAADDRPYVRQPVLVDDADRVTQRIRAAGLDLGTRWFNAPIHPAGSASTYVAGSAPEAERLARTVLSLPTHPRIDRSTAEAIAAAVLAATR